jgi:bacterioferritin-associated ferredoxin
MENNTRQLFDQYIARQAQLKRRIDCGSRCEICGRPGASAAPGAGRTGE